MLKFNTLCAVLAYLSSNLLNEVGLSLFRYFEVGLRVCDIVVKKFTFAISSPDEFLSAMVVCSSGLIEQRRMTSFCVISCWQSAIGSDSDRDSGSEMCNMRLRFRVVQYCSF